MYEEPKVNFILFTKDVIMSSGEAEEEWKDENTDLNGWT